MKHATTILLYIIGGVIAGVTSYLVIKHVIEAKQPPAGRSIPDGFTNPY